MKKYIFLATTICNLGGAQKYIQSKMLWLKEQGWIVEVVYYQDGKKILHGFDGNHTHLVSRLQYPIYWYKKTRIKIISQQLIRLLIEKNCSYEQLVIESTTIGISTWGELLANILGAKHIIYSLQENDVIKNRSVAEFLKFKHRRKELAGITVHSVYNMMHSFDYVIKPEQSYRLVARSTNPVEDYEYPLVEDIKKANYDYVIGSIGRLDKPFVLPTLKSVLEYVKNDDNNKYALLFIGGAFDEEIFKEQFMSLCAKINNVQCFITGFIYPIPSKLVRLCDMFISSSGSAGVSFNEGIPTVSIDGKDLQPIGVIGHTTSHWLFRSEEEIYPLSDYMDDVLKRKKYPRTEPKPQNVVDYEDHLRFIRDSTKEKEYYDVFKLQWNKEQYVPRFLMPLLGPGLYCIIRAKLYSCVR